MTRAQQRRSVLLILAAVLAALPGASAMHGQDSFPTKATVPGLSAHMDEAQRHLSRGILLASQKHYKAARLELEKADALQPGDFAILFNLGQVELRDGDNANAELALSRAQKLKPQSPETMYLLAQTYANESRSLDALDLLAKARDLAPENPDILFLMAQIGVSQRYDEDAIPLLEKATQLAPGRTDILTSLGETYFKAGRIDKSIATFTQLLHSHPSVTAYGYLGIAYTRLGRFDEARRNFQSGLKLQPANNFCLFQLGNLAKLQGDAATAEKLFSQVLRSDPSHPGALLSLAGLRMEQKRYPDAAELLQRYIAVSDAPAAGYYKLAMVEKYLHHEEASQRDLTLFQELSKDTANGLHPYDHLFDYIDDHARMAPEKRLQQDLGSLAEQAKLHPSQPQILYALAEAELKSGKIEQARRTISDLAAQRADDVRTLSGLGVLLARFGLYDDAINQFQAALQSDPQSDDVHFDLANAYFRKGSYSQALSTVLKISEKGRADASYSSLLADIDAHLGDIGNAESLYQGAMMRNPDNDQAYLALALLQMRESKVASATMTLKQGQSHIPGSGKLAWGVGLCSLLEGDTPGAATNLEKAVALLPEWPATYATLGFFYYQTGQIDKAREVLNRFKNSGAPGGLDLDRISQALASAPATTLDAASTLSMAQRMQVFQLAVYFADKTL